MASLSDATNKLSVQFKITLNNVVALALAVVFSESVANAEQATVIGGFLTWAEGLVSIVGEGATSNVELQVLDANGDALETLSVVFDPSVAISEQNSVLATLAGFATGTPEAAAAPAAAPAPAAAAPDTETAPAA